MIVYLSGPMTGVKDHNKEAFSRWEEYLVGGCYEVINPAHLSIDGGTWESYMKVDIRKMTYADAVAVLPGWQKSRGATMEVAIALSLGMEIMDVSTMAGLNLQEEDVWELYHENTQRRKEAVVK